MTLYKVHELPDLDNRQDVQQPLSESLHRWSGVQWLVSYREYQENGVQLILPHLASLLPSVRQPLLFTIWKHATHWQMFEA